IVVITGRRESKDLRADGRPSFPRRNECPTAQALDAVRSVRSGKIWQKGAKLAKGCKPGKRVQKVQKVGIAPAPLHFAPPATSVARQALAFCPAVARIALLTTR